MNKPYLEIGNLDKVNELYPHQRDWVVGSFIKESELRNSRVCEVKWFTHRKGFKKPTGSDLDLRERTLVVLISGKFKIAFVDKNEVILSNQGDYVIYRAMYHESEALENSSLVVVRWKEA